MRILVIGLGRFGAALADSLWRSGVEVAAVDSLPAAVDAVKERTSHAFVGDATDPKVLEGLGAAEMDAAVVTFGNAFEASVLCVATLHRLGVRTVVARAETPRRADILSAVGASRVIQLEAEMGRRLGQNLLHPADAELQDLASQYCVVPWKARGPLLGQSLGQADLPRRYGVTVLGYRRGGGEPPAAPGTRLPLLMPSRQYVIEEGDTLLLVGDADGVTRFFAESDT